MDIIDQLIIRHNRAVKKIKQALANRGIKIDNKALAKRILNKKNK